MGFYSLIPAGLEPKLLRDGAAASNHSESERRRKKQGNDDVKYSDVHRENLITGLTDGIYLSVMQLYFASLIFTEH